MSSFDLRNNPSFIAFAATASKGTGCKWYDDGVMSVVRQVQQTGTFKPNPLRGVRSIKNEALQISKEHRDELLGQVHALGWTLEQAEEFAEGVGFAETAIGSMVIDEDE